MASKTPPHPERERSEPSKDAKVPIHSQQKGLRSLPPLREVIARHGLTAKKSLGQNFILDLNVTRRIARAAADDESRPFGGVNVIEVGPGPGGLTRALLETDARRVVAIERDRRALAALQELAAAYPGRLALVEGDALALDPAALTDAPRTIVANLPYNIATALLLRWLDNMGAYESLTLMFQREVAERLVAAPRSPAYGRLSVIVQWLAEPKILFDLPPRAFVPAPKVTSSVVSLTPLAEPLAAAGIVPTARAEELSVAEFCALARAL